MAREGEPLAHALDSPGCGKRDGRIATRRLGAARNRAIDEEYLRAQFGRLGNTPYELGGSDAGDCRRAVRSRSSMLNQLRRDAVERLQAVQRSVAAPTVRTHR